MYIHIYRHFCRGMKGFQENCQFFAENLWKSTKIVIITLIPDRTIYVVIYVGNYQ
jgi:hypothetical protein